MKKTILFLLILTLLTGCAPKENTLPVAVPFTDAKESIGDTPISCMSFNILDYNTGTQKLPEPEQRAPYIFDFILKQDADIVGIQEAAYDTKFKWPSELMEAVGDKYSARMLDDEGLLGGKMNIAAGLIILYKTDRFELVESGREKYSIDSGRWFHWVKLKDKQSGRELFVTNTHYSINPNKDKVKGNEKRSDEARQLTAFWEQTVGNTPLFATGDYNSYYDESPHSYLSRGVFQSAKAVAEKADKDEWLDYIYVNTKCQKVEKYTYFDVEHTLPDGSKMQMSDHAAIMATCRY